MRCPVLTDDDKCALKAALQSGCLSVLSSDKDGTIRWSKVSDVLKHETKHKQAFKVTTASGRSVVATEDHSLFLYRNGAPDPTQTGSIVVGDDLAVVVNDQLHPDRVTSVELVDSLAESYDLSVPGDQNFVTTSGILAHNSYSVGGISLDLEKSSKYQSAAENYKDLFQTQLEQAKATVKIIKGLQQPKYGMGIRSSFGPYVGRGVLTPAKYIGF